MKTALEGVQDEAEALACERDRLKNSLGRMSRNLELAWKGRVAAAEAETARLSALVQLESERKSQAEEELRAVVEELQVLTEELEISNSTRRETNVDLDKRVEARTTEIERAHGKLRESEARFRTLIEGMPQLLWRSADGGQWSWCSPQWTAFTGLSQMRSMGLGWLDALHPEDRYRAVEAWEQASELKSLHFDARLYNVEEGGYRHFRTRAMPVRSGDGVVIEWLGTSTDVHDITQLRESQAVLLAELQHRTRNLMSVVQSVVARTLRGSSDLADFGRRMEPRLSALSRVQGLLSRRGGGERISLETLVREELAAHVDLDRGEQASRVSIGGPDVKLKSANVQIFALGLHELTTNALKYGALSGAGGVLSVHWDVRDELGEKRLHLVWREEGVRRSEPEGVPGRLGYGRELIERAMPYQLGARTEYALEADGVRCELNAPLDAVPDA